MVELENPKTWTKTYVTTHRAECLLFLREMNLSAIHYIEDDVCCKRCISNASNTTYSQLICGRMI